MSNAPQCAMTAGSAAHQERQSVRADSASFKVAGWPLGESIF